MSDETATGIGKAIDLERLKRFKERADETYATKADAPGVATTERAGLIKPGPDFDVAEDGMLSAYSKMAVSSMTCSPATAERGSTVDDIKLAWALNKVPTELELDGEAQDVASKGKELTGAGVTANRTFALKATDARGAVATRSAGIQFQDKRHWFVAGDLDADGVTDDVINAAAGELASAKAKTFTLAAGEGQHIYYAFPHAWGTPRFFVGGFEGGFALLKTFDHANSSGATVSYDVWKSTNAGLGATTVEVR